MVALAKRLSVAIRFFFRRPLPFFSVTIQTRHRSAPSAVIESTGTSAPKHRLLEAFLARQGRPQQKLPLGIAELKSDALGGRLGCLPGPAGVERAPREHQEALGVVRGGGEQAAGGEIPLLRITDASGLRPVRCSERAARRIYHWGMSHCLQSAMDRNKTRAPHMGAIAPRRLFRRKPEPWSNRHASQPLFPP